MTLGPSFAHESDLEKALRKVRTLAGVRFFGMPIGTVITPGMVRNAREQYGEKKTNDMLASQRRNTTRDKRQAFFQNQSKVRGKKREQRLAANAERRNRVKVDRDIREMEATKKPSAYSTKIVQERPAPKAAPSKTQSTNSDMDRLFDLVHAQGKWSDEQVADAIALAMKLKATADPMVRELLMALVKRLREEE